MISRLKTALTSIFENRSAWAERMVERDLRLSAERRRADLA